MNQCVPSWDLDDNPTHPRLDYEVAELTWENGQLAMHGLGPPRVPHKPVAASSPTKYTWDKLGAGGTLESIVDQATRLPDDKSAANNGGDNVDVLVPLFEHHRGIVNPAPSTSATMTMDALVPCTNLSSQEPSRHVLESMSGIGMCVVGCSTRVGSCSGAAAAAVDGVGREIAQADQSMTGSATCRRDSRQVTLDTCDPELGGGGSAGFTSASLESPENTSISQAKAGDHEEGTRKSSISTKRSRAAAIHNQSERKRRDKINQRMKTLQKLVPNSSKTDKASMLDEVIEYLKQLQAQVQVINRLNISTMMMPLAMQQQLQMSMMSPMEMGIGMGVMDMNAIGRAGMPSVLPAGMFIPMPTWDNPGDHLQTPTPVMPDPLSAFFTSQPQPMTMDAYSRIAAMYQQFQQTPGLGLGSKI